MEGLRCAAITKNTKDHEETQRTARMIGNHKGHEGHKGRETQISQIWADFWRAGARRLSRMKRSWDWRVWGAAPRPGREKFSLHPRHVRWTCQQDDPETCREKAKLLSLQASKLPIAPAPPARPMDVPTSTHGPGACRGMAGFARHAFGSLESSGGAAVLVVLYVLWVLPRSLMTFRKELKEGLSAKTMGGRERSAGV